MSSRKSDDFRIVLPQAALKVIFDECDRFDRDETGGRVIGFFEESDGKLILHVTGIIEAGPQARRTAVSFFQDGEHQERIFRQIELADPEIEHLGNWHTHHVNGLMTLSGGDIATYQRTVNHHNHNTPFFYALLVVGKRKAADSLQRYAVKHYIFRRNDDHIYEIHPRSVEIVETPLVWPLESMPDSQHKGQLGDGKMEALPERFYDQDLLREFYDDFHPFTSKNVGLYWRGSIKLLDGSAVQVVLVEDSSSRPPSYSVVLREPPDALKDLAQNFASQEFPSARVALINIERCCNRLLYEVLRDLQGGKTKKSRGPLWTFLRYT